MATKRVNIDIVAKDKSQQALNKVRGSLDKVKASVFNVRNALAGIGAGLAVRSLVKTGMEIESLQVRLKFLFGTAEEGAKAFDNMAKFASKVPFSLEEIQQGAGVLSVVSKDADELSNIMEITGNVAAVTGLDFRTASEQIQRSLSAGISAADLFRERGVRDLLGFKAGATVTAEETAEAFQRVFGKGGQFGGATDELATTLGGTLSMIGDKVFNFKKTLLDAGFFAELKKQFGDLNKFLEDNSETLDKVATEIGVNLAKAVVATANGMKTLANNMDEVKIVAGLLLLAIAPIPTTLGAIALAIKFINDESAMLQREMFGVKQSFEGLSLLQLNKELETYTKRIKELEGLTPLEKKGMGLAFSKELFTLNEALIEVEKKIADLKNLELKLFPPISEKEQEDIKKSGEEIKNLEKFYTNFTNAMSLRYRKEQELIRITRKEQEAMNEAYTKAMLERGRINDEVMTKQQTALSSFTDGFIEQMNAQGTALEQFNQAGKKAFDSFADTLTNALMTGKFAFQDFARSVILDITRIIAKQMIMLALQKAAGFFSFGGFSLGGLLSFGGGKAQGGAVQGGKAYMVGEKGPEMFVPNQSGNIVPNNQISGQPVTVNFNINTVDARGFNELLVNSRGLIVNMINSAVNEKGKMAIV
jgi:hypothetical protein